MKLTLRKILKGAAVVCAAAVMLCSSLFLTGCDRDGVAVVGSTSLQPYVESLAEEFMRKYPETHIDVQGGGSSAGINKTKEGVADVGMSSRGLKASETGLTPIKIASDGLAVIINPKNPLLETTESELSLTERQIRKIYNREYLKWSDVAKDLGIPMYGKDSEIYLMAREAGSGTRTVFEDLIMGSDRITSYAMVMTSNGGVRSYIADNPNAIGFISLGLVPVREKGKAKPVTALHINGVAATEPNVAKGEEGATWEEGGYLLARPFLFVIREGEEIEGVARDFLNYVLSEEGQTRLEAMGLIPIPKEDWYVPETTET